MIKSRKATLSLFYYYYYYKAFQKSRSLCGKYYHWDLLLLMWGGTRVSNHIHHKLKQLQDSTNKFINRPHDPSTCLRCDGKQYSFLKWTPLVLAAWSNNEKSFKTKMKCQISALKFHKSKRVCSAPLKPMKIHLNNLVKL